jgi:putative salt-induced outer membrane protein YdiY
MYRLRLFCEADTFRLTNKYKTYFVNIGKNMSKITSLILLIVFISFSTFTKAQAPLEEIAPPEIEFEDEKDSEGFLRVSIGVSSKSGNTESDSYSGRIETGTTINKTVIYGMIEGAYAESEVEDDEGNTRDERTEGRVKAVANAKQRFDGFFLFANASAMRDSLAGIDFRGIFATGVGTYLVDTDDFKFSVEAGVAYVVEEADEDDDYFALRLAERIDYNLTETTTIWESAEIIPEASDFGNFLANIEFGIEAAVNSRVSIGLLFQLEHDAEPTPEVKKKTDTTIGARITLSL